MTPSESPSQPPLFVVVCTRYHKVLGIYGDPRVALAKAQELTASEDCEYVPVPFIIAEGIEVTQAQPSTYDPHHNKGYL